MLNIDVLTYGCEFKDVNGNIYVVTSHMADNGKIMVTLEPQVEALIEDKLIDK